MSMRPLKVSGISS